MERKVAYYETDKMGIVHHSNYVRYMEEARLFWLEENALAYDYLEQMGIMLPVVSIHVDYLKSLKFGDSFKISTNLVALTNVKITLSYEIRNSVTEDICATGESVHCFVDDTFKPIALRKRYPEIFDTFKNNMSPCL